MIFGWTMYDWANSAYATALATAVLPLYFAGVVVPADGFSIGGTRYAADTLWSFLVAGAALLVFLLAPTLGAIADLSATKKRFLVAFCYAGVVSATLLYFSGPGDVWWTMVCFLIAHACFVSANVFYDSFLPQIAPEGKQDWLSSKGFAYGYIGGGLQFAFALALISGHQRLGIEPALAARIAMLTAALWWGGFALFTVFLLREPDRPTPARHGYSDAPGIVTYARLGLLRVWHTALKVRRLKHLLLFLVAFMIYNDGIQTVILEAALYGRMELGLSDSHVMITLLIVQFVAVVGALAFAKLTDYLGTKRTVMLTLVGWSLIVIYAFFLHSMVEFFVLGMATGFVLGGSQALSRSLYGSMIPQQASAEFFGFYSVFSKFSSIWGPLTFGVIRHVTGSSRYAILSLILFFLVGLALLAGVDQKKAQQASAQLEL